MADTIVFKRSQTMYPYWVNYPPTVPQYPASQTMFRREVPEKFTKPKGRASYQNWTDKWYDWDPPIRREEELPKVADRREPCSRPWMYRPGTSAIPTWTKEGKDWPSNYDLFLRTGSTNAETKRARALQRLGYRDQNLYAFSNNMTSYRRPVFAALGPMLRPPVYGLNHQHNRHGNMPFEDYY
ncbi:hypothetical protein C0Q70_08171 [Pomacea canaliculata]|uniref:Uncharacterized protein n=1 Tax=Pomacea canaliculata TaxID=400727 RepID=A0A2T7PH28_POMCA|nr:uncharacterized protein LOC112561176 [Pomacea canaliculata]PVD32726.1 hypothetical protein C0Q70_08171 [Pomacea canaliculata]